MHPPSTSRSLFVVAVAALGAVACGSDPTPPLATAEPGVVFAFPADQQVDVPTGARIVVTFSDPVEASALGACSGQGDAVTGAFCLVGPAGAVDATPEVTPDGHGAQFTALALEPGTAYAVYVRPELSPTAKNLPASGPLIRFTTRIDRPRAAAPALVAVNGSDPTRLGDDAFRPMFDTSTIRLLFSEPLDPRTVTLAAGSVELVDAAGAAVAATLVARGIHVSIDPIADLTAGATYTVRLGAQVADLGGQSLAPTSITLVPRDTRGTGPIPQVLRTRQAGDPGPDMTRAGADPNVITIDKPLIGAETSSILPGALAAELGDPKALGGPIAFTMRRGQRLRATGLDVHLGGVIPAGLQTGDIEIELLTDGGGRVYRNPFQPAEQRPENDRAPLYVDLSLDVAISAVDPTGQAVLTQTVLGMQATGTAVATDGVLAFEAVMSMDLGLLGVTSAPTNLVLQLITDPAATADVDTTAPTLVATYPPEGSSDLPPGAGIELIFSEPVDLDRARAGGIRLETATGAPVASVLESHGSAVVVRPRARLAYSTAYRVVLADVADVAGNDLADTSPVAISTEPLAGTGAPLTVVAAHPGVPCTLTDGSLVSPGRCAGGNGADDLYRKFTLPADEPVEVAFSQPPTPGSVTHGTSCNTGSVRIEEVDAGGGCVAAVPGTFLARDRSIAFVPDAPWVADKRYRLTLVSGSNTSCGAGEICGLSGDAASFDPLNGTGGGDSGGGNLVIDYTGAPASDATFMMPEVAPATDLNGSGTVDNPEPLRDENRAALRITGTTGDVSDATFTVADCIPSTPEVEGCLYLIGAMPVALGELATNCPLPDGTTAPSCIPVTLSAQAMYGTSVSMDATAVLSISADTGTTVMRVREPVTGPVTGYIIDDAGTATLVVALDLYMDAPDMDILLSSHDLHSKPLSVSLRGPVEFLPDGRIAIGAANVADVPVSVNIDGPLGIAGSVEMVVPRGEMKLQLVSPPLRGAQP